MTARESGDRTRMLTMTHYARLSTVEKGSLPVPNIAPSAPQMYSRIGIETVAVVGNNEVRDS